MDGSTLIAAAMGLVASGVASAAAFHRRRVSAALFDSREEDLKLVTPGMRILVSGTSKTEAGTVRSPVTDRICILWRLVVEAIPPHGQPEQRVLAAEYERVPLTLEIDEVTVVLNEVSSFERVQGADETSGMGEWTELPERLRDYLSRAPDAINSLPGGTKFRYAETCIGVGEEITIVGAARWSQSARATRTGGYRGGGKAILIERPADGPIVIAKAQGVQLDPSQPE